VRRLTKRGQEQEVEPEDREGDGAVDNRTEERGAGGKEVSEGGKNEL
jgi:hypothetical protein